MVKVVSFEMTQNILENRISGFYRYNGVLSICGFWSRAKLICKITLLARIRIRNHMLMFILVMYNMFHIRLLALGWLILCTVLPNNFFRVGHNFFLLFRYKAMQKTKNQIFLHFLTRCKPFEVLLHNASMSNGARKKIQIFSNFPLQNYTFFFWIWILYEKCDLLRYIMLM